MKLTRGKMLPFVIQNPAMEDVALYVRESCPVETPDPGIVLYNTKTRQAVGISLKALSIVLSQVQTHLRKEWEEAICSPLS